jgi:hypothetical protein
VIVRRLLMPLTFSAMAVLCVEASAQGAFPAPLPNQSSNSASPFPNPSGSAASSAPAAASPFPPVNNAAPAQRPAASASPFPNPSSGDAAASQGVFSQGARPLGGGLGAGGFGGAPPQGGGGGGTAEQQDCMEKFAPLRQDAEKRAKMIQAASERKAPPQEACGLIKAYVQAEAKLVNYVTTKQTACGIPAEIPKQLKANQGRSQQMMKAVCQAAAQPQGGGAGAAPSLSEVLGTTSGPEIRSVRSGGSTFDTINGNVLAR